MAHDTLFHKTYGNNILVQVALNQLALGPLVTTAVFAWNLVLQQKGSELPEKLRQDLIPTMVNGEIIPVFELECKFALFECLWHCRVEVLGASSLSKFLGCTITFSGAIHVCLWVAVDSLSFVFLQ